MILVLQSVFDQCRGLYRVEYGRNGNEYIQSVVTKDNESFT